VDTVDGQAVASLSHLVELLSSRDGESHRIMLEDSECEIVLRHEDVDRRSQEILDRYRVPADRSPDLMAMKPSPAAIRPPSRRLKCPPRSRPASLPQPNLSRVRITGLKEYRQPVPTPVHSAGSRWNSGMACLAFHARCLRDQYLRLSRHRASPSRRRVKHMVRL